MSENILEKIISKKTEKIKELQKTISVNDLAEKISSYKSYYNFKDKILNNLNNLSSLLLEFQITWRLSLF